MKMNKLGTTSINMVVSLKYVGERSNSKNTDSMTPFIKSSKIARTKQCIPWVCIHGRWEKRKGTVNPKFTTLAPSRAKGAGHDQGEARSVLLNFWRYHATQTDGVHMVVHFYYPSLNYIFFIIYGTFHNKILIT